jgi:hypothetical protein
VGDDPDQLSDQVSDQQSRRTVVQAMRALLSDDHNYERGVEALTALVDRVGREGGPEALRSVSVQLALALASALERIAQDQGLAAEDLVEVWFAG